MQHWEEIRRRHLIEWIEKRLQYPGDISVGNIDFDKTAAREYLRTLRDHYVSPEDFADRYNRRALTSEVVRKITSLRC